MAAFLQNMERATTDTKGEQDDDNNDNKIEGLDPDNSNMDLHLKEKLAIMLYIFLRMKTVWLLYSRVWRKLLLRKEGIMMTTTIR